MNEWILGNQTLEEIPEEFELLDVLSFGEFCFAISKKKI